MEAGGGHGAGWRPAAGQRVHLSGCKEKPQEQEGELVKVMPLKKRPGFGTGRARQLDGGGGSLCSTDFTVWVTSGGRLMRQGKSPGGWEAGGHHSEKEVKEPTSFGVGG